jgi:SNF2 family DNA or RNA helicase
MSAVSTEGDADGELRSELSKMIDQEITRLNIRDWLNSEEAALSSRFGKVLETLDSHDEKVVVFSSYRTCINTLGHYIKEKGRKFFTLSSGMSPAKRREVIGEFRKSKKGVLGLTYQLGAQGLNLQFASVAYILDFDWTSTDTVQAIARLARMGQETTVRVYYFICGAGVEKAVLDKQLDKNGVLKKLMQGKVKRLMKRTQFSQFINDLTSLDDNIELVDRLYISPDKYNEDTESEDEASQDDDHAEQPEDEYEAV